MARTTDFSYLFSGPAVLKVSSTPWLRLALEFLEEFPGQGWEFKVYNSDGTLAYHYKCEVPPEAEQETESDI